MRHMEESSPGNAVLDPALQNPLARSAAAIGLLRPSSNPTMPPWAMALTEGTATSCRIPLDIGLRCAGSSSSCEVVVRTGRDAALVSVLFDGHDTWTDSSLASVIEQMIDLSLEGLQGTSFSQPARLWNFLPEICAPIGDGVDRYRVFNAARHRAFSARFGEDAIANGRVPPASCVGHNGHPILIGALGVRGELISVENPRQIPAFEYSPKFGPKPPCFSRAGIADFGEMRALLVAGTASVLGEESTHEGSLEAQLRETVLNLRAILDQGRRTEGAPRNAGAASSPARILATRVYYRRFQDRPLLEQLLPPDLVAGAEVEFVHAEICRRELLVEIEVLADLPRA